MREIKFKGKRIDNGEWAEGDLTRYSKYMSYITVDLVEGEVYEVLTPTVGQYTGLHDKNGKEIYEGDIVTYPDGDGGYEYCDEIINSGVVTWSNISLCYFATNNNTAEFPATWECIEEIQVIGNIHDNPELLDG